jgi:hypothetical protein
MSPEGNQWVDAGSIHALFFEVADRLVDLPDGLYRLVDASVEILATTPREQRLRIEAHLEPLARSEGEFLATLHHGSCVTAMARGRVTRA